MGMPTRILLAIATSSEKKFLEMKQLFSPYGIRTERMDPRMDPSVGVSIPDPKYFAVLQEESILLDARAYHQNPPQEIQVFTEQVFTERAREQAVIHRSRVQIWYRQEEQIQTTAAQTAQIYKIYQADVEGVLRWEYRDTHQHTQPIFGWDDIFYMPALGVTLQELKELKEQGNLKISARQKAVGQLIREIFFYDAPKSFAHFQANSDTPVATFVQQNPYLMNIDQHLPIAKGIHHAVNMGLFFRTPLNRRQHMYWLPGLNAGIPATPKKDAIHEITFWVHDLFHMLMPDLLLIPEQDTQNAQNIQNTKNIQKRVYTIWRMMSEACTFVLADMFYVDALRNTQQETKNYDWSKRRIYPVYQEIKHAVTQKQESLGTSDVYREILWANIRMFLLGDPQGYQDLSVSPATLEHLLEKYIPFFVEDYRWTLQNYQHLCQSSTHLPAWLAWMREVSATCKMPLDTALQVRTVDDVIRDLGLSLETHANTYPETYPDTVQKIFGYVWEKIWQPALFTDLFTDSVTECASKVLAKARLRYMLGQMYATFVYEYVALSKIYRRLLQEQITQYVLHMLDYPEQQEQGEALWLAWRTLYRQYIDYLAAMGAVQEEERATFQAFFPVFPPFYINYDRQPEQYPRIQEIWERL